MYGDIITVAWQGALMQYEQSETLGEEEKNITFMMLWQDLYISFSRNRLRWLRQIHYPQALVNIALSVGYWNNYVFDSSDNFVLDCIMEVVAWR